MARAKKLAAHLHLVRFHEDGVTTTIRHPDSEPHKEALTCPLYLQLLERPSPPADTGPTTYTAEQSKGGRWRFDLPPGDVVLPAV
jgi:hypothetical protein